MTHVNLEMRTLDKIPANTCHPACQLDQSPSSKSCFRDSRPTMSPIRGCVMSVLFDLH